MSQLTRRSAAMPLLAFNSCGAGAALTPPQGAVDQQTLAALTPRLDVFERAGQEYHRSHPEVVDARVIDDPFCKSIGLHIQDSGCDRS